MVVLDTSTLVLLAKASLLESALRTFAATIPTEVRTEALAKPGLPDAQLVKRLISDGALSVQRSAPAAEIEATRTDFSLGLGEAAALLIARHLKGVVGTDDAAGIRAAKALGIPFVTSLHVLIQLHRDGHLTAELAEAKLEKLTEFGRYSERIMLDARQRLKGR